MPRKTIGVVVEQEDPQKVIDFIEKGKDLMVADSTTWVEKGRTQTIELPDVPIELSVQNPLVSVLNDVYGVDGWAWEISYSGPTSNYRLMASRGILTLRLPQGDASTYQTFYGQALIPFTGDPNACLYRANKIAMLNALASAGYEVDIPKFDDFVLFQQTGTQMDSAPQPVKTAPQAQDGGDTCGDCGGAIAAYTSNTGKFMSVAVQKQMTTKNYGAPLCRSCNGKRYAASRAG